MNSLEVLILSNFVESRGLSPTRPRLRRRLRRRLSPSPYRYNRCVAFQITSEVSGSFRDLLLVLLRGERDESAEGDPEAAEAQAEGLHDTDGKSVGSERKLVQWRWWVDVLVHFGGPGRGLSGGVPKHSSYSIPRSKEKRCRLA